MKQQGGQRCMQAMHVLHKELVPSCLQHVGIAVKQYALQAPAKIGPNSLVADMAARPSKKPVKDISRCTHKQTRWCEVNR